VLSLPLRGLALPRSPLLLLPLLGLLFEVLPLDVLPLDVLEDPLEERVFEPLVSDERVLVVERSSRLDVLLPEPFV
jgi:hypothetical protein